MATLIHSARLIEGGAVVEDAWVLFEGDRIAHVDRGPVPQALVPVASSTIDAAGRLLTPGFIDLHCHGGGGAAFDDGDDAASVALGVHRRHGTTRAVLSLVSAPLALLERRLEGIARRASADPLVLGAHLEGPFLAVGHKGAHDPATLRAPEPTDVDRLLAAADGQLVQLTLAPELPGALEAVRALADAGVAVAVGHTDADFDEARAAFDEGASLLTHAFNGMNGIHHRSPGPVVAALGAAHVTLEIVADGMHLHPAITRLAFDAAPGRIALVSDAMAAAGAGDGDYELGGLAVEVRDGCARLAAGGAIAGSTLTLDAALRHAVTVAGVPLPHAVRALTETPARAIGREGELGRIAPGFVADAVLLDDDLEITGVWAAGERLV